MAECWKCGAQLDLPSGPLSFRATCEQCGSALHSCINCKNFRPGSGLPNQCAIPGTDFVADREGSNFCEEFLLAGTKIKSKVDPDAIKRRLFGEDGADEKRPPDNPKGRFDSLFGD